MGAKNEVSTPHPAAVLSWRAAAVWLAFRWGVDVSLAMIPEGLRDIWCVWCALVRYLYEASIG